MTMSYRPPCTFTGTTESLLMPALYRRRRERHVAVSWRIVINIICYSDTHGQTPQSQDDDGVTAILHGGDFYDGRILRYATGREACEEGITELRRVTDLRWLASAKAPVYAVNGNHDVADP